MNSNPVLHEHTLPIMKNLSVKFNRLIFFTDVSLPKKRIVFNLEFLKKEFQKKRCLVTSIHLKKAYPLLI